MGLASSASAQQRPAPADAARYQDCLAQIEVSAPATIIAAETWSFEGGGALAEHCAALAEIAAGDPAAGAQRLEEAAQGADARRYGLLSEFWAQAGGAWFVAGQADRAETAFSNAINLREGDAELWIDRGVARLQLEAYDAAERDFSEALKLRPRDLEALKLRGRAAYERGDLVRAQADTDAALARAPQDVEALRLLGDIREARRLERLPQTQ